jgi:hypothetical protein
VNSTDLVDRFRSDVFDTAAPYLWSADEALSYANDAYMMFVRLTGGISDFSSEAAIVSASANDSWSDLHPSVLTIRKAYRADGKELAVLNAENDPTTREDDYGRYRNLTPMITSTTVGALSAAIIGLERDKVRWYYTPASNEDVTLLIYRLPLVAITADDQALQEVADIHHIHLLSWMKALAYRKADPETFDRGKATENETRFRAYCAQAKAEWERYKHKPRIVAYGGI